MRTLRAPAAAGAHLPDRAPDMPEEPTVDDVCRLASFRVVAASSSPTLRRLAHMDDRLFSITLESRNVEVTTELRWSVLNPAARAEWEPTPEQRARDKLESLIYGTHVQRRKRRSEAAEELDAAAAHQRAGAQAAASPLREMSIELDGQPIPFACVQHDACWAAAAHVDDRTITVATRAARAGTVTLQTHH